MQNNQIQRRGKPSQLQVIQQNNDSWLFNNKCKQFFALLQEGQHIFPYCSRKKESLTSSENEKKNCMMELSTLLGIPTNIDKSILLYFKPVQQLGQPYNQELIANLQAILIQLNAEELLKLSYTLDNQFIQELTTILHNIDQIGILVQQILNNFHNNQDPASYYQIVKNSYLHHVKSNEDYMSFQNFVNSDEAVSAVFNFIDRIHHILEQN
ncbi:unnamed protein product [Paramecium pentaurelia]|uniref:Uncharacterized protein n=1 Tax=Paramecium pentaurelia TaxID=43138 RepID=A0A8S1S2T4_9CILI|nr:unnamed protein product [Paramecium pentaurelia]